MKALYIPSALLVVLLLFCLWSSSYIRNHTDQWTIALEEVNDFLENEQWDSAQTHIRSIHENWNQTQNIFHMLLAHQDLDETELLFSGAIAACHQKDPVELQIYLDQLSMQLMLLADTQRATLGNIL
ncbi:MAG: DUF4363 family protein [Oscillospiraceae bacterium]|nr:DUF4363 family protein [Oscillospiraceae bacterium]